MVGVEKAWWEGQLGARQPKEEKINKKLVKHMYDHLYTCSG